MVTESIDTQNNIKVEMVLKVNGFSDADLEELWRIRLFPYLINELLELKKEKEKAR